MGVVLSQEFSSRGPRVCGTFPGRNGGPNDSLEVMLTWHLSVEKAEVKPVLGAAGE